MRQVLCDVPQGSILGSILYSVYTNELQGLVTSKCQHQPQNMGDRNNLFGVRCDTCRAMISYSDDLNLSVSDKWKDNPVLKETLDRNLDEISQFLEDNGLAINKSKTKLLRLTTRQQRTANDQIGPETVTLNVRNSN